MVWGVAPMKINIITGKNVVVKIRVFKNILSTTEEGFIRKK